MNKKLKFHLYTNWVVACFLTLTACSSIESTTGNHGTTTSLLSRIDQDHERPENPPVRVGQPYDQGTPPLE
jgi:hypothetical protein